MGKVEYQELSSAQIQDQRSLVISACSRGGYTLAQRIVVNEGTKKTNLFLKNAIHVEDEDGLYNLRDALNDAIEIINKK